MAVRINFTQEELLDGLAKEDRGELVEVPGGPWATQEDALMAGQAFIDALTKRRAIATAEEGLSS